MLERVGIFALGLFVSFILAMGLVGSRPNVNVRAAFAVIGGALGGAPILFLSGVCLLRWIYPLGLVGGLVLFFTMGPLLDIPHRPNGVPVPRSSQTAKVITGLVMLALLLCLVLGVEPRILVQTGTVSIDAAGPNVTVYLPTPYAKAPSLNFPGLAISVVETTPDHFVVTAAPGSRGHQQGTWVAEGVPRCE